jgi:hypothetical protein
MFLGLDSGLPTILKMLFRHQAILVFGFMPRRLRALYKHARL